MTDAVTIAIIGGFVSIVITVSTLIVNYKIEKIHKQINSRMDELLAINKKASKAEGKLEEKEEEKVRVKIKKSNG